MGATIRSIAWISRLTFAEAVRMRLVAVTGAAGLLLIAAAVRLREFNFGAPELRFVIDLGFGAIGLGATFLAVLATSQLFFGDLERRTVHYVLSRPVSRAAYLAGKLLGVLAVLAVFCAALTAVLTAVAVWRARALGVELPIVEIFAGGAALWLRAAVAAGMTLFVCSYARTAFFAASAGLLLALIGFLRPAADWRWLSVFPNLQLFEPTGVHSIASGGGLFAYAFGYLVVFMAAASLAFRYREL